MRRQTNMKKLLIVLIFLATPALSDPLDAYLWKSRPLVVFAQSADDPRYQQQMRLIEAERAALEERDVVILTDVEPMGASLLRKELRPNGFTIVLVGKDGTVKLRKPVPWDVRELSRAIDKMPLRQQEAARQRQRD